MAGLNQAATLTIKLEDDTTQQGSPSHPPGAPGGVPPAGPKGGQGQPAGAPKPPKPFDPMAAAKKLIEKEARAKATAAAYRRLKPPSVASRVSMGAGLTAAAGRGLGGAGAALAQNNLIGAAGAGLAGISPILSAIGPVAGAIGAVGMASLELLRAFKNVTEGFIQRGRELARSSPQLAGAGARASVRAIGADIREAQETGPGLARLTDVWSELTTDIREMLLPIKRFLVETLASFLEAVKEFIEFIKAPFQVMSEAISTIGTAATKAMAQDWQGAREEIQKLPERIADALKKKDKMGDDFLWQQFFKMGEIGLPDFGPLQDPVKRIEEARLNQPLFAGM